MHFDMTCILSGADQSRPFTCPPHHDSTVSPQSAADGVPGDTGDVIWKNHYAPSRLHALLTQSGLCALLFQPSLELLYARQRLMKCRLQRVLFINTPWISSDTGFIFFLSLPLHKSQPHTGRDPIALSGGVLYYHMRQRRWGCSPRSTE